MQSAIPETFTPVQLAKAMGIRPAKVYAFIESGELVAEDWSEHPGIGRPRWRIPAESVIEFRHKRRSKPAPDPVQRRRHVLKSTRNYV